MDSEVTNTPVNGGTTEGNSSKEVLSGRIEDYKGNVLMFGGGGNGSGGIMVGAEEIDGVDNTTRGSSVADNTSATNLIISATNNPSTLTNLLTANVEDLKFGDYAIVLRLRTSNKDISDVLVKVTTYFTTENSESLLSTTYIKGTDFDEANDWQSFGFLMKFKGTYSDLMRMKIRVDLPACENLAKIDLDYIIVNYAYSSKLGINTILA